jgi:rod shape-determining protein MreB
VLALPHPATATQPRNRTTGTAIASGLSIAVTAKRCAIWQEIVSDTSAPTRDPRAAAHAWASKEDPHMSISIRNRHRSDLSGTVDADAKPTARRSAPTSRRPVHVSGLARTGEPAAVAVDLGSSYARLWVAGWGTRTAPHAAAGLMRPERPLWRGRVTDSAACEAILTRLLHQYPQRLPADPVVVACRPVLAAPADQEAVRRVVTAVFAPGRMLFIDTVRAAAIGAGVASGVVLIADVGAQIIEVAVLADGRTVAARRADRGTRDMTLGASTDLVAHTVARLVQEMRRSPGGRRWVEAALPRGLVLVGDGATWPQLTARLTEALPVSVRSAARSRTVALHGAGMAALAACRHRAVA